MPQDRAQRPQAPGPGSDPGSGQSSNTNSSMAGTYFLGRYRVVDEIGIGGMASVHLARMDGPGGFQKWVAIKRIHPHLVEDDSFVHMFLDEARIAARISHPNVASVFELGKHEDTYWIAMEYLHGEPLREVMRRTEETGQPMPPEIACRVIADAAEGLHAAHELLGKNGEKLGLVHRDVTPHNLFVTYDGTTKVVDFGIAKFSSRMASTRAGTLKGKLAYMSPEQVAGEQIDRRTDLFALGVVLWELTTGQRLFRMESDLDTLAKVQECNVPRPTQVVRGYPLDLEKIVMKALAKNKNERYKTAREFSRALQSLLMRRGLFIASDEVAGYVQAIFVDRIRKREEHLRWAAEVTQTINIDGKLETPAAPAWNTNEPSVVSYNSDVQASPQTVRGGPRPAAGAPPVTPPQPSIAEHFSRHPPQPSGPRPGASMETVRPPAKPQPGLASTQATAAAVPKAKPSAHAPHPGMSEPPTMRASPKARDEVVPVVGDEDDFDDSDDTIVTSTRPDFSELAKPSAGPLPAAGRPPPAPAVKKSQPPPPQAAAFSAPPRSVPPRAPAAPPLPAVVLPTASIEQGPQSGFDQTRTAVGESPFQQPLLQRSGSMSGELPDPLATARSHAAVEVQRLFAPPPRSEQRTMIAASLRGKKLPLWAIAGAAAFFALVSFAVILFILLKVTAKPASPPATATNTGPLDAARSAFAALLGVQAVPPPAPSSRIAPETPGAPASAARAVGADVGDDKTSPPDPSGTATVTLVTSAASGTGAKVARTAASLTKPPPAASSAPTATGPAFGSLTIVCRPACEQVMDGGSPLGPSPIYKRKVGIGGRRITLVWTQGRKTFSTIVMADQEAKVFGDWP